MKLLRNVKAVVIIFFLLFIVVAFAYWTRFRVPQTEHIIVYTKAQQAELAWRQADEVLRALRKVVLTAEAAEKAARTAFEVANQDDGEGNFFYDVPLPPQQTEKITVSPYAETLEVDRGR